MFAMEDQASGRIKFKGSEAECLEFSKQNPSCKYIMIDLEKEKKEKEQLK